MNGLRVFMHGRLSKTDVQLKEAAEKENLLVTTNNSAPMVKIELFSGRQNESTTHFIPRTPFPQLFRQPNFMPMTPQSTSIPTLKRSRHVSQTSDTSNIIELKSRVNNRADPVD